MRRVLAQSVLALVLAIAPASAQQTLEVPPPILIIDRDRLFAETAFGRRVLNDLEERAAALVAENRDIEAELIAEEQALTDDRPNLSVEEFRALADAFDEKVQQIRAAQDAKSDALNAYRENAQQAFSREIVPVLSDIMRARGALVMLNRRDVVLSAQGIDVTDEVIRGIDARVGDGTELEPQPAGD